MEIRQRLLRTIFLMADSHSGLEKPRKDGSAFPHFHKARLRYINSKFPFLKNYKGSAKATTVIPDGIRTYCRPSSMYVLAAAP